MDEILAELWSLLVIDGNPVITDFVKDEAPEITVTKSEEWKVNHEHESKNLLEIVKCTEEACCSPFLPTYLKVVIDRFLAPPLPVVYSSTGIEWAKDDKEALFLSLFQNTALSASLLPKHANAKFPKGAPYDYSCSSIKDGSTNSRQNHVSYCRSSNHTQCAHISIWKLSLNSPKIIPGLPKLC